MAVDTSKFTASIDHSDLRPSEGYDSWKDLPNGDTIAAMLEAERIVRDSSVKRYSDVEEALRTLKD